MMYFYAEKCRHLASDGTMQQCPPVPDL